MAGELALYTQKILDILPHWFSMRKSPTTSVGAQFLNVAGLELDEASYLIEYAYNQTRLSTMDTGSLDIVYKAVIPGGYVTAGGLVVSALGSVLAPCAQIDAFYAIDKQTLEHPEMYGNSVYWLDAEHNLVYVKNPYPLMDESTPGTIKVWASGKPEIEAQLVLHHVWNAFDETGLLVGCRRLYGEKNADYKTRLLDVFKNKGGSGSTGLLNGVARDLGLRHDLVWEDGGDDLLLDDGMIVLNQIRLDGTEVDVADLFYSADGCVALKGDPAYAGVPRNVSYVRGIEILSMPGHRDSRLNDRYFTQDGTATERLKQIAAKINGFAPDSWGGWRFGRDEMDVLDYSGSGRQPSLMDGGTSGFASYDIHTGTYVQTPALFDLKLYPASLKVAVGETIDVNKALRTVSLSGEPSAIKSKRGETIEINYNWDTV